MVLITVHDFYPPPCNREVAPKNAKVMLGKVTPWLMAQVVVMPMMGMGLFSGAFVPAFGSLIGHLVYGAIVGAVYSSTKGSCSSCTA